MVSIWPWRGDDTSPASFEKTLSTLSKKITKTSNNLENLRQRSRRFKALWTLYSGFAYLLYSIILVLVVGWRDWGPAEYTAVAGGPLVIYVIRLGLANYYSYRTSNVQGHLDGLQKQRDATIDRLKTATKYNTTHQLLEKYSGTPTPKGKPNGTSNRKSTPRKDGPATPAGDQRGFVPPPTANIPGRIGPVSLPNTPRSPELESRSTPRQGPPFSAAAATAPWQRPSSPTGDSAEFAPNAFSAPPEYASVGEGSRWYDRMMDVLLGEDESLPRNRIALICNKCRLVNGQAPPGVKRLEDLGRWRCGGCGAPNGEEIEAKRIVATIKEEAASSTEQLEPNARMSAVSRGNRLEDEGTRSNDEENESDITQYSEVSDEEKEPSEMVERVLEDDSKPDLPKPKRGRPKGSVKKKS